MPGSKKASKSPARSADVGRSSRATARKETRSRSRSRSSGRKPKAVVSDITEMKEVKVVLRRSPARQSRILQAPPPQVTPPPQHVLASQVLYPQSSPISQPQPSPARKHRSTSKSPPRQVNTHTDRTVIKRSIVSTTASSYSSSSSSTQEQASVTPVRTSSRIASLIEKEKEESSRLREQMRSHVMSSITTPPTSSLDSKMTGQESKKKSSEPSIMAFVVLLIVVLVPLLLIYVNLACGKDRCSLQVNITKDLIASLFDVTDLFIVLAWFFFHIFLAVLPVGRVVKGPTLKSGGRLNYRCNGLYAVAISLGLLLLATYFGYPVSSTVYRINKMMISAVVFSIMLSVCLYVSSRFVSEKKLAPAGNTGNIIYDFFIGRELNPRVGMLDLKMFCVLRPGLIGWLVLMWILVIRAYEEQGSFSPNLVLVTAVQTLYIVDALWYEDVFLTTVDIVEYGGGFMIVFGGLALVPFFYSLQSRFIYASKLVMPWYCLAPLALMNFVGYTIFRLSSNEKINFRNGSKHPSISRLETIATNTGKDLLVSGWWGVCRKPHYLGDLIQTLSWSLMAGFDSLVPYLYFIYMLIMLIHRDRKDSENCRAKYGASWDRYCERVKYRILPYVY